MKIVPKISPTENAGGYCPVGSDRYPIHVIYVSVDKRTLGFVKCDMYRIDNNGISEEQEWKCVPRTQDYGNPTIARLCKNGHYYTRGGMESGKLVCPTGQYEAYQDPSF